MWGTERQLRSVWKPMLGRELDCAPEVICVWLDMKFYIMVFLNPNPQQLPEAIDSGAWHWTACVSYTDLDDQLLPVPVFPVAFRSLQELKTVFYAWRMTRIAAKMRAACNMLLDDRVFGAIPTRIRLERPPWPRSFNFSVDCATLFSQLQGATYCTATSKWYMITVLE